MKTFLCIVALATSLVFCSYSQETRSGSTAMQLNDLKAPSSPAFTILGMQPSEIARPNSLNSLVAGLYSSFTDNNSLILPKNYALEFTPYWLSPHPMLTFTEYAEPNSWQSALQNSSVSLATSEVTNEIDTTNKHTRMGIGYRTLILSGQANTKAQKYIKDVKALDIYQKISSTLTTAIEQCRNTHSTRDFISQLRKTVQETEDPEYWRDKEEADSYSWFVKTYFNSFLDRNLKAETRDTLNVSKLVKDLKSDIDSQVEPELTKAAEGMQKAYNRRTGFILEVAAALALDFPSNRFDFSKASKYGFWITPTYRIEDPALDVSGVLRYLKNENMNAISSDYSDNTDYGVGLSYEQEKFSLYGEIIVRSQKVTLSRTRVGNDYITTTKSRTDLRYSLSVDYRLSDSIVLTYSFGKNFDQYIEFSNNLLSLVSLSFNFASMTPKSIGGK